MWKHVIQAHLSPKEVILKSSGYTIGSRHIFAEHVYRLLLAIGEAAKEEEGGVA
jgi:hypothetical protein